MNEKENITSGEAEVKNTLAEDVKNLPAYFSAAAKEAWAESKINLETFMPQNYIVKMKSSGETEEEFKKRVDEGLKLHNAHVAAYKKAKAEEEKKAEELHSVWIRKPAELVQGGLSIVENPVKAAEYATIGLLTDGMGMAFIPEAVEGIKVAKFAKDVALEGTSMASVDWANDKDIAKIEGREREDFKSIEIGSLESVAAFKLGGKAVKYVAKKAWNGFKNKKDSKPVKNTKLNAIVAGKEQVLDIDPETHEVKYKDPELESKVRYDDKPPVQVKTRSRSENKENFSYKDGNSFEETKVIADTEIKPGDGIVISPTGESVEHKGGVIESETHTAEDLIDNKNAIKITKTEDGGIKIEGRAGNALTTKQTAVIKSFFDSELIDESKITVDDGPGEYRTNFNLILKQHDTGKLGGFTKEDEILRSNFFEAFKRSWKYKSLMEEARVKKSMLIKEELTVRSGLIDEFYDADWRTRKYDTFEEFLENHKEYKDVLKRMKKADEELKEHTRRYNEILDSITDEEHEATIRYNLIRRAENGGFLNDGTPSEIENGVDFPLKTWKYYTPKEKLRYLESMNNMIYEENPFETVHNEKLTISKEYGKDIDTEMLISNAKKALELAKKYASSNKVAKRAVTFWEKRIEALKKGKLYGHDANGSYSIMFDFFDTLNGLAIARAFKDRHGRYPRGGTDNALVIRLFEEVLGVEHGFVFEGHYTEVETDKGSLTSAAGWYRSSFFDNPIHKPALYIPDRGSLVERFATMWHELQHHADKAVEQINKDFPENDKLPERESKEISRTKTPGQKGGEFFNWHIELGPVDEFMERQAKHFKTANPEYTCVHVFGDEELRKITQGIFDLNQKMRKAFNSKNKKEIDLAYFRINEFIFDVLNELNEEVNHINNLKEDEPLILPFPFEDYFEMEDGSELEIKLEEQDPSRTYVYGKKGETGNKRPEFVHPNDYPIEKQYDLEAAKDLVKRFVGDAKLETMSIKDIEKFMKKVGMMYNGDEIKGKVNENKVKRLVKEFRTNKVVPTLKLAFYKNGSFKGIDLEVLEAARRVGIEKVACVIGVPEHEVTIKDVLPRGIDRIEDVPKEKSHLLMDHLIMVGHDIGLFYDSVSMEDMVVELRDFVNRRHRYIRETLDMGEYKPAKPEVRKPPIDPEKPPKPTEPIPTPEPTTTSPEPSKGEFRIPNFESSERPYKTHNKKELTKMLKETKDEKVRQAIKDELDYRKWKRSNKPKGDKPESRGDTTPYGDRPYVRFKKPELKAMLEELRTALASADEKEKAAINEKIDLINEELEIRKRKRAEKANEDKTKEVDKPADFEFKSKVNEELNLNIKRKLDVGETESRPYKDMRNTKIEEEIAKLSVQIKELEEGSDTFNAIFETIEGLKKELKERKNNPVDPYKSRTVRLGDHRLSKMNLSDRINIIINNGHATRKLLKFMASEDFSFIKELEIKDGKIKVPETGEYRLMSPKEMEYFKEVNEEVEKIFHEKSEFHTGILFLKKPEGYKIKKLKNPEPEEYKQATSAEKALWLLRSNKVPRPNSYIDLETAIAIVNADYHDGKIYDGKLGKLRPATETEKLAFEYFDKLLEEDNKQEKRKTFYISEKERLTTIDIAIDKAKETIRILQQDDSPEAAKSIMELFNTIKDLENKRKPKPKTAIRDKIEKEQLRKVAMTKAETLSNRQVLKDALAGTTEIPDKPKPVKPIKDPKAEEVAAAAEEVSNSGTEQTADTVNHVQGTVGNRGAAENNGINPGRTVKPEEIEETESDVKGETTTVGDAFDSGDNSFKASFNTLERIIKDEIKDTATELRNKTISGIANYRRGAIHAKNAAELAAKKLALKNKSIYKGITKHTQRYADIIRMKKQISRNFIKHRMYHLQILTEMGKAFKDAFDIERITDIDKFDQFNAARSFVTGVFDGIGDQKEKAANLFKDIADKYDSLNGQTNFFLRTSTKNLKAVSHIMGIFNPIKTHEYKYTINTKSALFKELLTNSNFRKKYGLTKDMYHKLLRSIEADVPDLYDEEFLATPLGKKITKIRKNISYSKMMDRLELVTNKNHILSYLGAITEVNGEPRLNEAFRKELEGKFGNLFIELDGEDFGSLFAKFLKDLNLTKEANRVIKEEDYIPFSELADYFNSHDDMIRFFTAEEHVASNSKFFTDIMSDVALAAADKATFGMPHLEYYNMVRRESGIVHLTKGVFVTGFKEVHNTYRELELMALLNNFKNLDPKSILKDSGSVENKAKVALDLYKANVLAMSGLGEPITANFITATRFGDFETNGKNILHLFSTMYKLPLDTFKAVQATARFLSEGVGMLMRSDFTKLRVSKDVTKVLNDVFLTEKNINHINLTKHEKKVFGAFIASELESVTRHNQHMTILDLIKAVAYRGQQISEDTRTILVADKMKMHFADIGGKTSSQVPTRAGAVLEQITNGDVKRKEAMLSTMYELGTKDEDIDVGKLLESKEQVHHDVALYHQIVYSEVKDPHSDLFKKTNSDMAAFFESVRGMFRGFSMGLALGDLERTIYKVDKDGNYELINPKMLLDGDVYPVLASGVAKQAVIALVGSMVGLTFVEFKNLLSGDETVTEQAGRLKGEAEAMTAKVKRNPIKGSGAIMAFATKSIIGNVTEQIGGGFNTSDTKKLALSMLSGYLLPVKKIVKFKRGVYNNYLTLRGEDIAYINHTGLNADPLSKFYFHMTQKRDHTRYLDAETRAAVNVEVDKLKFLTAVNGVSADLIESGNSSKKQEFALQLLATPEDEVEELRNIKSFKSDSDEVTISPDEQEDFEQYKKDVTRVADFEMNEKQAMLVVNMLKYSKEKNKDRMYIKMLNLMKDGKNWREITQEVLPADEIPGFINYSKRHKSKIKDEAKRKALELEIINGMLDADKEE